MLSYAPVIYRVFAMKQLSHLLLSVSLLCSLLFPVATSAQIKELDYVMVVVNEDVITYTELQDRLQDFLHRQKNKRSLPPEHILQRQLLEHMIVELIQLQLAEKSGIRVSDETVNNNILMQAKSQGLTIEQMRNILAKDGYTYEQYREELRKNIILQQLKQRHVYNRVNVSEQEIDNYLATAKNRKGSNEEYNIGHILISVPESATPDQIRKAQARSEEVIKQLQAGADFTRLAIAESAGPQALKGGKLGWKKAVQLPTIIAGQLQNMKIGDISQPVRSASGFHIFKLLDKRSPGEKHLIEQTLARHILIRPSQLMPISEATQRLTRLRQRIIDGEDFASLARSHSDDKGSAADGGSLGWINPGMMVQEFEQQMNRLKPGEISEPFQSRFGIHIVQVLSRRNHDDTEAYERLQAKKNIRQRKVDEAEVNWLRSLRSEAYVEYRINQ